MTDPHPDWCLYQCAGHHGAGPKVHTIDCPTHLGRTCCDNCRADIVRQEIAADPYARGDYVAMFGDDA